MESVITAAWLVWAALGQVGRVLWNFPWHDVVDIGIMTFIVNQQGRVYEKDLGTNTLNLARKMTEYNPDKTWKPSHD